MLPSDYPFVNRPREKSFRLQLAATSMHRYGYDLDWQHKSCFTISLRNLGG